MAIPIQKTRGANGMALSADVINDSSWDDVSLLLQSSNRNSNSSLMYGLLPGSYQGSNSKKMEFSMPKPWSVGGHIPACRWGNPVLYKDVHMDTSDNDRMITQYGTDADSGGAGTVPGAPSKFGIESLNFKNNSYLTVPHHEVLDFNGDRTIEFWMRCGTQAAPVQLEVWRPLHPNLSSIIISKGSTMGNPSTHGWMLDITGEGCTPEGRFA